LKVRFLHGPSESPLSKRAFSFLGNSRRFDLKGCEAKLARAASGSLTARDIASEPSEFEHHDRVCFNVLGLGTRRGQDLGVYERKKVGMSLREGLREMPSNAAGLLSRARDRQRGLSAAVRDAAPIGGDSVEIRMKRAEEAAERARDAEQRALEATHEAEDRSDHAREVSEHARARVAEVERETERQIKQRVAEAEKAAADLVKREREAAEADAEEERQEVYAEVDEEIEAAERDAEEAQQRADELLQDAAEQLAEARRLAEESVEAARAKAAEAQRQAQQLADEAEQQVKETEARIAAAEQIGAQSKANAKGAARELQRGGNGGLQSHSKPELLDLAAGIGIEGRTTMRKGELIDAIAKASRSR
jgi:hypothetical protein